MPPPMESRLSDCPISAFALAAALAGTLVGGAVAAQVEVVDRILAVVSEDPILASDVDRMIALELVERRQGESDVDLRRRVLDQLIEEKLRFHELDRFGFAEVPVQKVDDQFEAVSSRYGGEERLAERLERLGLDELGLRQLLARQLMVLIYVEERLGPRVFVDLEDIRAYHSEVLTPELESGGATVPPIQEVREQIRAVLKEQRLNEEIERWTEELRAEADVDDYFDSEHSGPPPP